MSVLLVNEAKVILGINPIEFVGALSVTETKVFLVLDLAPLVTDANSILEFDLAPLVTKASVILVIDLASLVTGATVILVFDLAPLVTEAKVILLRIDLMEVVVVPAQLFLANLKVTTFVFILPHVLGDFRIASLITLVSIDTGF